MDIKLPTDEKDIPAALKKCQKELKRIDAERALVEGIIDAIRSMCSHNKTESGNTWGRWAYTRCKICGEDI